MPIFTPPDIQLLSDTLESFCIQHLVSDSSDRDEYARQILAHYTSGIRSRGLLLERMNSDWALAH